MTNMGLHLSELVHQLQLLLVIKQNTICAYTLTINNSKRWLTIVYQVCPMRIISFTESNLCTDKFFGNQNVKYFWIKDTLSSFKDFGFNVAMNLSLSSCGME